jgi:hypothetical protein
MSNPTPPREPGPGGEKPQGTSSLVAQIVAEQKQQKAELADAMTRKVRRRRLGPVAGVVLVVANVVAWLVFPPVTTPTGDTRSPAEVERDLRLVIASAAGQVEAWRTAHDGRLPPTLSQAGVRDADLSLVNVDGTIYEVRGESRGLKLSYRSNSRIGDFLDAGIPGRP